MITRQCRELRFLPRECADPSGLHNHEDDLRKQQNVYKEALVHRYACLSACPCLSVRLSVTPSIYLSILMFVCPCVLLAVSLSVCLSARPPVSLSIN